ncbi:hypothetical protein C8F01DRAFT_1235197 [Mycena amicta]|nr:hypothetical protein C8F01DRAFT_1235197 [Mycena amicta]
MSRPADGVYFIYNRALSPQGEKLAMVFNGNQQPITVTPLNTSATNQRWEIRTYDRTTQHVIPMDDKRLEAGWGAKIYTLVQGNYVWNITHDNGYCIKDGGRTISWSLCNPSDRDPVVPLSDYAGANQRWIFQKVDYNAVNPSGPNLAVENQLLNLKLKQLQDSMNAQIKAQVDKEVAELKKREEGRLKEDGAKGNKDLVEAIIRLVERAKKTKDDLAADNKLLRAALLGN